MYKMKKKGFVLAGMALVIAIILGIVASVAILGYFGIGSGLFSQAGSGEDNVLKTSETSPTLTFVCIDKYNKGKTVSCHVDAYKLNGGNVQTDADNAIEVNCGDDVEAIVNASNYYNTKVEVIDVECSETPQVSVELLAYDTAVDIQVYNQDDGLLNTDTNDEGLPANSQHSQRVVITGTDNKGIQGGYFFVNAKSTYVDDIDSSLGSSVEKPSSKGYNSSGGVTLDMMRIFSIGTFEDSALKQFTFTPDIAGTAYDSLNMTIGILDKEWYVAEDGSFEYGFQNDEKHDVGQANDIYDELFYTNTA